MRVGAAAARGVVAICCNQPPQSLRRPPIRFWRPRATRRAPLSIYVMCVRRLSFSLYITGGVDVYMYGCAVEGKSTVSEGQIGFSRIDDWARDMCTAASAEKRMEWQKSFRWRHEENRVGCYGPVGSCTSLAISSAAPSFSPFTL